MAKNHKIRDFNLANIPNPFIGTANSRLFNIPIVSRFSSTFAQFS